MAQRNAGLKSENLILSEAKWQEQVIELAQLLGWRVAHFRAARTEKGWRTPVQADGKGFPDLVLLRGDEIIVAELKSEAGRPSKEQTAWLRSFEEAGVRAYLWRPRDFDLVHEVLAR